MSSIRVFTDLEAICGLTPAARVIDGIATSEKMCVIFGAGVSVTAGIPVCANSD